MPQVSMYIDRILYFEIKSIAEKKNVSLSKYVSDVLRKDIENSWPEGYFDLVGSLKDDDRPIELPEDLPWSLDAPMRRP